MRPGAGTIPAPEWAPADAEFRWALFKYDTRLGVAMMREDEKLSHAVHVRYFDDIEQAKQAGLDALRQWYEAKHKAG